MRVPALWVDPETFSGDIVQAAHGLCRWELGSISSLSACDNHFILGFVLVAHVLLHYLAVLLPFVVGGQAFDQTTGTGKRCGFSFLLFVQIGLRCH